MFSPRLQSLLVEARVEDLYQDAHTTNRGHVVNRPNAGRLFTVVERAMSRVLAGGLVSDEAAPALGHR